MFKNLKVRNKLILAFGIVIFLYIVAIIASSIGLNSVAGGLKDFFQIPYPMVKASLQAQSATRQIQLDVFRAYVETDAAKIQTILSEVDEAVTELDTAIADLKDCYQGDAAVIESIDTYAAQATNARTQALEFIAVQDNVNALYIMDGDYATACDNLQAALRDVVNSTQTTAQEYYDSNATTQTLCTTILYSLAAVSLILTVILVLSITKGLTRPISEIEDAIKGMAQGNMHSEVSYQSRDELGVLADNLRFVLTTLSGYIHHICSRLDSLATGDLTVEMDMDYLGEFESIKESGNQIIEALNDTLGQLHQASEQVASGSEQVSSGAQALSQGATEQASSVEELAATINELSEQVSQTAQNARGVNELIEITGKEVENSNTKMEAMMSAMTKINESSSEIEKIIKTIEDIAFQTNILALNAAVEAARAGEAGKGFAVVADEVRSLASKSAEAAKDTTALISNSLAAVSEGNRIAEDTQSSLIEVVKNAQKIATNMSKITEASDMQAEGIQQVTQGIDQISSVVQTNSATAQESAAASEELFSQSSLLKSLVGRFRLKGSAAAIPNLPAAEPVAAAPSSDYEYDDNFVPFDNSKY